VPVQRGLLFGIYSAAGNKTCEGYAASWGHEDVDAADFASWGVDYLKYDFCDCQNGCDTQQSYTTMGRALNATGRQFMYNVRCCGVLPLHLRV
jgi:alpha-galactosidase